MIALHVDFDETPMQMSKCRGDDSLTLEMEKELLIH